MKYIKNHLMFIFPLMAILLGIESYLVFERITSSYEKSLKEGYSMFVVTQNDKKLQDFTSLNKHIESMVVIKRDTVVSDVIKGLDEANNTSILNELPYFYSLKLNAYVGVDILQDIENDLKSDTSITSIEIFGSTHNSSYKLFMFIKLIIKIFVIFIIIMSLSLIVKQMEIWRYTHQKRMRIMEIFGAPLMLRSGVLFKLAFIDAIWATIFVSGIFSYLKFMWASESGIEVMVKNQNILFNLNDIAILLISSLVIVMIAVYFVVFSSKGIEE